MRLGTLIEDVVGGEDEPPAAEEPADPPPTPPAEAPDAGSAVQVEDLEHRLDGVEADVEEVTRRVEGVQNSQDDVVDQIEDLEETIRRLVGVYDQVAADANPFVDDGGSDFGVVDGAGGAEPNGDDVVGFGDLEDARSGPDDEEPRAGEPLEDAGTDARAERAREGADADSSSGAVPDEPTEATGRAEAGHSGSPTDQPARGGAWDAPGRTADADGEAYLSAPLCHNYASDLLIFEWLSALVAAAGPAAALRAVEYYERIGWIDQEVKAYLEATLSGPVLDVDVDPRQPQELTARDHATSYEHIVTLETLKSMGETGR